MAIVGMPYPIQVTAASFGQVRYDMVEQSESTGSQSTRVLAPPRWRLQITAPALMKFSEASKWESLTLAARGRVNHIAAYDPGRLAPAGTMRGTMRTVVAVPAGATSMQLVGGSAGTLLAGDPLQIGTGLGTSQYVKAVSDTASVPAIDGTFAWDNGGAFVWTNSGTFVWTNPGLVTVTFESPLRQAFAQDTPVTWDRPLAYYKSQADSLQGNYMASQVGQGGYSLDLLEAFS